MNSTEILDAVNARLLEKWPERTVYTTSARRTMNALPSGSRTRATTARRSRGA